MYADGRLFLLFVGHGVSLLRKQILLRAISVSPLVVIVNSAKQLDVFKFSSATFAKSMNMIKLSLEFRRTSSAIGMHKFTLMPSSLEHESSDVSWNIPGFLISEALRCILGGSGFCLAMSLEMSYSGKRPSGISPWATAVAIFK